MICLLLAALYVLLTTGASEAAAATSTQTLCSTGAGKPVVMPTSTGACAPGQTAVVLANGAALTALQGQVNTLQGQVSSLKTQVSALQATLAGVSRTGATLRFSGMNIDLNNGSGTTTTANGLGNLFIGYNENPGSQTGSHNLIVGDNQTFTAYGGIIGGEGNTLTGPYSVAFGAANKASNFGSSVSGGAGNIASGTESSVSGGLDNAATDSWGAILGGCSNLTGTGTDPNALANCGSQVRPPEVNAVSGGANNTANGGVDSILGGGNNKTGALDSAILGGNTNSVSTNCATFPNTMQSC